MAPPLVALLYVVALIEADEILTTVDTAAAETPIPVRLLSPLSIAAIPVATEASVSPDCTVYVLALEPPESPASKTVPVRVSPAVIVPPTAAVCTPFGGMLRATTSVAVLLVEAL